MLLSQHFVELLEKPVFIVAIEQGSVNMIDITKWFHIFDGGRFQNLRRTQTFDIVRPSHKSN
jgi:hypothetical protein